MIKTILISWATQLNRWIFIQKWSAHRSLLTPKINTRKKRSFLPGKRPVGSDRKESTESSMRREKEWRLGLLEGLKKEWAGCTLRSWWWTGCFTVSSVWNKSSPRCVLPGSALNNSSLLETHSSATSKGATSRAAAVQGWWVRASGNESVVCCSVGHC